MNKPTSWPTIFPPQGGHIEVAAIADYVNERIEEARLHYNEVLRAQGKAPLSGDYAFEAVYLPKYPRDGWRRVGAGVPPFQIIGPGGLGGFGLHEFQGQEAIKERINEMNRLAMEAGGAPTPPAPSPVPTPTTPPPSPVPGPAPAPAPGGPLPPGTIPPFPTPGGGPPPVVVPVDPNTVRFTNGVSLKLLMHDTRFPGREAAHPRMITAATVGFYYTDPENIEVVAKVIDGRGFNQKLWVFSAGMTDVGVTLMAVQDGTSKIRAYRSEQGQAFPTTLDTAAF